MGSPVFNQLNVVVRDMDATLEFYRAAGLRIPDETVWRTDSGAHHVQVAMSNGVDLEFDSETLAKVYNKGWRKPSDALGRCVIGLSMETRDAVDQRCKALADLGYTVSQPPFDTFWGARYAIVLDPDGNNVGLMSPSDPGKRSAPPNI